VEPIVKAFDELERQPLAIGYPAASDRYEVFVNILVLLL